MESFFKKLVKKNALPLNFYNRYTVDVAKDLIGKILLVKKIPSNVLNTEELKNYSDYHVVRIVETEAYGQNDPASHSARGLTPRSSIMFGPPGFVYVYFIYGMYEMLNFVTEARGTPGAVLIRAVEPLSELSTMTNGPGKLCRALGIRMVDNGLSLHGSRFYTYDDGYKVKKIYSSGRVGIRLGQDLFWRFYLPDNPHVSRVPQNKVFKEILLS